MLLKIDEPQPIRSRGALLALGFRPFYLCAGIFAMLAIALWVARYSGLLGQGEYLANPFWHAHEMIFGYSLAVIIGFLFTAVRNWTGQPTPTGYALAAIVASWLSARVLLAAGYPVLSVLTDVAFVCSAAWGIGRPLHAAGNHRNQFFVLVLLAIGLANLIFLAAIEGIIDLAPRKMLTIALDLILFVMVVMGGRVIPMFTANALPESRPQRPAWLERAAPASVLVLLAADLLGLPAPAGGLLAALATMVHGMRLALWHPWHTWRHPILWILHASYAWIVLHLALRTLAALDPALSSLATHALAVGGIGGLTLGMMTRTARGHTGRMLTTNAAEVAAYACVQLAAAVRVLLPLIAPAYTLVAVQLSGVLWVAAFALFVAVYAPILWRPRIDGKPG